MYLADDNNGTLHVYSTLPYLKGYVKSVNIIVLPMGTLRPRLSSANGLKSHGQWAWELGTKSFSSEYKSNLLCSIAQPY